MEDVVYVRSMAEASLKYGKNVGRGYEIDLEGKVVYARLGGPFDMVLSLLHREYLMLVVPVRDGKGRRKEVHAIWKGKPKIIQGFF